MAVVCYFMLPEFIIIKSSCAPLLSVCSDNGEFHTKAAAAVVVAS